MQPHWYIMVEHHVPKEDERQKTKLQHYRYIYIHISIIHNYQLPIMMHIPSKLWSKYSIQLLVIRHSILVSTHHYEGFPLRSAHCDSADYALVAITCSCVGYRVHLTLASTALPLAAISGALHNHYCTNFIHFRLCTSQSSSSKRCTLHWFLHAQ